MGRDRHAMAVALRRPRRGDQRPRDDHHDRGACAGDHHYDHHDIHAGNRAWRDHRVAGDTELHQHDDSPVTADDCAREYYDIVRIDDDKRLHDMRHHAIS
jgi:hypothetical protein